MKRLTLIPLPLLCIAFCLSACSDKDQDLFFESEAPPPTGNLIVQMSMSGSSDQGTVGCGVMLDGHYCSRLDDGGRVTLNVPTGQHTIALVQLPKDCYATDGTSRTVRVRSDQTSEVFFTLHCGDEVPPWKRQN